MYGRGPTLNLKGDGLKSVHSCLIMTAQKLKPEKIIFRTFYKLHLLILLIINL